MLGPLLAMLVYQLLVCKAAVGLACWCTNTGLYTNTPGVLVLVHQYWTIHQYWPIHQY